MSSFVELIAKKRDGGSLAPAEIQRMIGGLMDGTLADYQMTAFLMAVFLRGMTDEETVALTQAMLHSGDVINFSDIPALKVDKHSTGGVGDKVSICLAPLVAACGTPVPMVSGRGLGHTGGTLDKLEAIPGFRTDLPVEEFKRAVRDIGTSMIGQTKEIAPADKRIYALRDVTATVECIPLIVASILSKKLAEGIDGLVLDVKVGRGAFMKDLPSAVKLAEALVSVGTRAGKRVSALLTSMNAPLGRAIGNAIETREALEVLQGKGPSDLVECTMLLAEEMLLLGKTARTGEEAREKLQNALKSGAAQRTAEKMISAHHGDSRVVTEPDRLANAPVAHTVIAKSDGFVSGCDALEMGLSGVALGAGRTRADQAIDPAVGIWLNKKPGEAVRKGDTLATIYVQKLEGNEATFERIANAFTIASAAPTLEPLLLKRIIT